MKRKNKEKIINLLGAILFTRRPELRDYADIDDQDRIDMIICFVLDIAEMLGITYDMVAKNIRENADRPEIIADYLDRAYAAIEETKEEELNEG